MQVRIDRGSGVPAYRQIASEVARRVREGGLAPGEALPAERELARELGVARGTVVRAYDELERDGIIERCVGRGSRVAGRPNVSSGSRKDRALAVLRDAISRLRDLRFSHREIRALFELAVAERAAKRREVFLLLVDCNPESLALCARQLGAFPRVEVRTLLLDEAVPGAESARRLGAYDLVVTTATHDDDLLGRFPWIRDRLVRAAIAPSRQTVLDLASLRPDQRVGIVCESAVFAGIVRETLAASGRPKGGVSACMFSDSAALPGFLLDHDVLIVPAGRSLLAQPGMAGPMRDFSQRGGTTVSFEYRIDRGSLLHIEERIRDCAARRSAAEPSP